jgi:hypothetical protein
MKGVSHDTLRQAKDDIIRAALLDEMLLAIPYLVPALNPQERALMLPDVVRVHPGSLRSIKEVAARAIDEREWAALETKMPATG